MHAPSTLNGEAFRDPRTDSDFAPQLFPTANGKEATLLSAADGNGRMVIEFLTACYHINVACDRLRELRKQASTADQDQLERCALQAIEKALLRREALEDEHARIGVVAEPIMQDGLTVDVKFTFGNVNAAGRSRFEPVVFSAELPIRVPSWVRPQAQNAVEESQDSSG